MTNLLKLSLRRSSVVLLGLALICLLKPSYAHAQSSGPSIDTCSSTLLDEDPYIEVTTCIVGDSTDSFMEAYADATSSEAEDIGVQVEFTTPNGEIDSLVGCGYQSASTSASLTSAPTGGYYVYTLYSGDGPDWNPNPPYSPLLLHSGECGISDPILAGDAGPYVSAYLTN